MSDRRSAGERGKDAPEVHVGRELALDEVLVSHRSVVQRHRCLEECILARAIIRSVKVVVAVGIFVTSQQSAYTLNTSSAVFRTMKDRGSDCSTVTSGSAVHWRRMETYCFVHAKGYMSACPTSC